MQRVVPISWVSWVRYKSHDSFTMSWCSSWSIPSLVFVLFLLPSNYKLTIWTFSSFFFTTRFSFHSNFFQSSMLDSFNNLISSNVAVALPRSVSHVQLTRNLLGVIAKLLYVNLFCILSLYSISRKLSSSLILSSTSIFFSSVTSVTFMLVEGTLLSILIDD